MPDMAAAKILVADDDQSLVRTLMWILKENGYEVIVAPGGEGLMGKLEEERPHLLLLDIMMPKVDGLQLLAKMKADERFRDLPVLMISSMPPEEATVKSLGLGAADFIAKPFRVRELLARVKAHIRTAQELAVARDEAQSRAAIVDILHEVTDSLKPDEIYHILVRRVARVLQISKCSMVLAKAGDQVGVVVAAYEKAYDFETAVSDKKRLEKLAATDALTGCLNRRALSEELEQELDRAGRYNLALTILLADIDRFKLVNDTRGHIAGDSVLRQIGAIPSAGRSTPKPHGSARATATCSSRRSRRPPRRRRPPAATPPSARPARRAAGCASTAPPPFRGKSSTRAIRW